MAMQGSDLFDIVPRRVIGPVAISTVVFTTAMVMLTGQGQGLYHMLMLGIAAAAWRWRLPLAAALRRLPLPGLLRMVVLGYLAVMAEEALVGTLYALSDGAAVGVRVAQFIRFNLFAFSGLICSLALARGRLAMARTDLFLIAGGWGLYAEGAYRWVLVQPVMGGVLILPTMMVYSLILWPAQISVMPPPEPLWHWPLPLRLAFVWALAFALSLPPMAILIPLRIAGPNAFPPCAYIACDVP